MTKIPKIQIIILLFTFCFLFSYNSVKAVKLDLTSEIEEIGINQQFQVDLVLDTENEYINAVEGKVIFPEDFLELKEIREGNSIVNFWIERPQVDSGSQIDFSGITPGGYIGKDGLIFSMIFEAKKEGERLIEIQETKTLLNDGKGTEAKTTSSDLKLLISKETPSQPPVPQVIDNDSPEAFIPEIAKDPSVFEGKWFLVFATQDKKSGIDFYEILEWGQYGSWQRLIEKEKWQKGESPYLLKDQRLKSYIYVKAVDKQGNERIATLEPKYPPTWYENYMIWATIIIIGLIFAYIIFRILWKISKK